MDREKIRVHSKLSQEQVICENTNCGAAPAITRNRNQERQFEMPPNIHSLLFIYLACCLFIVSCHDAGKPGDKKIVSDPLKMDQATSESIQQVLAYALQHNGAISDSD